MRDKTVVRFVELAYRLDVAEDDWLRELARLADDAYGETRAPTQAAIFHSHPDGFSHVHRVFSHDDPEFVATVDRMEAPQPLRMRTTKHNVTTYATSGDLAREFGLPRAAASHIMKAYLGRWGTSSVIQIQGADYDDHAVGLTISQSEERPLSPKRKKTWLRVAAHLGAGLRIRRSLMRDRPDSLLEQARAVFDTRGRPLHIADAAKEGTPREALVAAVESTMAARSGRGQDDPEGALDSWRALFDGEFSVLEVSDTDGKALLVAVENQPELRASRKLTRRESQVARLAARGASDSLIAYELGLDESTVRTHLRRVLAKTGLRSRIGLIRAARIILGASVADA